ncbi:type II toxin-antitoxin system HicB family antitoxin, partial [Shigella flexneri]|uniref:type II toxin-antitoxin system HicB family antitoxin n=1 Tax=Shigella flexneri TaxID=623 RepID=UPI000EE6A28B
MRYPVTLTPAPEGGYMVSFVDIPEALTQGETVAEAMEAAKDAWICPYISRHLLSLNPLQA